jgi:hypothetical protein
MAKIFISYRRNDSPYIAATIHDRIQQHFGRDSVFFDIDNIPFGVDFRKYIGDAVGQCNVFLLIIGNSWIGQRDDQGHRRLDDPSDYVRLEIESALKRNIPVIPVLVDEAAMPSPSDLPASIQDVVFRNAAEIRAGSDLHQHLGRLIRGLEAICGSRLANHDAEFDTASNVRSDGKFLAAPHEIKALLKGYADPHLHLAPNIQPDKLIGAIGKYASELHPEDVLLLYDNTYMGSARDGFCLTRNAIYWHNLSEAPGHMSYQEINTIKPHYRFFNSSVWNFSPMTPCISINGHKIDMCYGQETKILANRIVNIIVALKDTFS